MGLWRARCLAIGTPGSEVRAGETDRPRGRHRAPARPYWYVLEEAGLELLLVNARHVKILPAARPMSVTPPGWRSCWSMGCCGVALCLRPRSGSCGILSAIASG